MTIEKMEQCTHFKSLRPSPGLKLNESSHYQMNECDYHYMQIFHKTGLNRLNTNQFVTRHNFRLIKYNANHKAEAS